MIDKIINGFHIRYGLPLQEYMLRFGDAYDSGELWDFSLEEIENGAVEPNEDMVYWAILIDDKVRIFETYEVISC